ncbi:MAG: hypothetical protein LBF49_00060 [Puniceicoccales bacterium]|jgi:hypothetical protein|nr:hypothetical protein [Puniceicoccales bacterium]
MEIINERVVLVDERDAPVDEEDVPHARFYDLSWRQLRDTVRDAAMGIFPQWITNSVNFVRSLESRGVESLRQVWGNISSSNVVEFAKKHYFITAIALGVAIVAVVPLIKFAVAPLVKFAVPPLVKFALFSFMELLHLLARAGLAIVSPIFRFFLKWTVFSMVVRIICHMDLSLLNPIISVISQKIVDPISVFLMRATMVLAAFMLIASIFV